MTLRKRKAYTHQYNIEKISRFLERAQAVAMLLIGALNVFGQKWTHLDEKLKKGIFRWVSECKKFSQLSNKLCLFIYIPSFYVCFRKFLIKVGISPAKCTHYPACEQIELNDHFLFIYSAHLTRHCVCCKTVEGEGMMLSIGGSRSIPACDIDICTADACMQRRLICNCFTIMAGWAIELVAASSVSWLAVRERMQPSLTHPHLKMHAEFIIQISLCNSCFCAFVFYRCLKP